MYDLLYKIYNTVIATDNAIKCVPMPHLSSKDCNQPLCSLTIYTVYKSSA